MASQRGSLSYIYTLILAIREIHAKVFWASVGIPNVILALPTFILKIPTIISIHRWHRLMIRSTNLRVFCHRRCQRSVK